jgi:hypothetical protein
MRNDVSKITPDTQKEIIKALSERIMAYYVFPDVAEKICTCIQQNFEEGVYADINESDFFAYALTTHVQKVSQDKHLWVRWHPEPLPEYEGSLLQSPENIEEFKQRAKVENYGIHKVERLPGNIGIIDIRYFFRTSWGSGETIVAAMNFLANMNAIIVDLRKCTGGNPGAVAMICSYFFDGEPIHLNSLYWRENDVTEQYWTSPYVPGKRITDQPVYILTSKDTFSGGEEFAYNLQTRQRAIIIGEITGGGAHPGSPYRLHPHFEAFIPNGRAINPITNENWEGVGIQPDILVSQEQALRVATEMALEAVITEIGLAISGPLGKLVDEAKTALDELKA